MNEYHVLSLGAGIQSTCLYLMGHEGLLPLTHAIFADTGEETDETMAHLQWLDNLHSIPIHFASRGRLGDDLIEGQNSTGQRFASIPVFTKAVDGRIGRLRRQCTKEYKIDVVDRCLRRTILGLVANQHIPKTVHVNYYFGISADEARRTNGLIRRFQKVKWATVHFPLIERWMTRRDCQNWMRGKTPHNVPSSSCVFCPFHDNKTWVRLKRDPIAWARIVKIDNALRGTKVLNRNVKQAMFLHRTCKPINEVDFTPKNHDYALPMFSEECAGMCGN